MCRFITVHDDDVSFCNSTASTWTLATPRTTWESVLSLPLPEASVHRKTNFAARWVLSNTFINLKEYSPHYGIWSHTPGKDVTMLPFLYQMAHYSSSALRSLLTLLSRITIFPLATSVTGDTLTWYHLRMINKPHMTLKHSNIHPPLE